jgi:hypothetical protein
MEKPGHTGWCRYKNFIRGKYLDIKRIVQLSDPFLFEVFD